MNWITEERYAERMHEEVEPWLAARKSSGYFERVEGRSIYYEHFKADDPKAVIVISHGFTEAIEKYTESIYYMLQAGYEVWGLDYRGHGHSYRHIQNPYVVHIGSFPNYVQDLVYLTATLVKPASGSLPVYLYCHSMGGCIGAWAIEDFPAMFQKAVLSSPMMALSSGEIPLPVVYTAASIRGIGDRRKEPLNRVDFFPETPDFENSLWFNGRANTSLLRALVAA